VNRPLYVSGESYGGHYVPNLAAAITAWNAGTVDQTLSFIPGGGFSIPPSWDEEFGDVRFDFRGILVGNPWTLPVLETGATLVNLWSRGYISDQALVGTLTSCDMSSVGPVLVDAGMLGDLGLPSDVLAALQIGAEDKIVPVDPTLGYTSSATNLRQTQAFHDDDDNLYDEDDDDEDDAEAEAEVFVQVAGTDDPVRKATPVQDEEEQEEEKRKKKKKKMMMMREGKLGRSGRRLGFAPVKRPASEGRIGGVPERQAWMSALRTLPSSQGQLAKWAGELLVSTRPSDSASVPAMTTSSRCTYFLEMANADMGAINIYDIYADVCTRGTTAGGTSGGGGGMGAMVQELQQMARQLGEENPASWSTRHLLRGKYDPCIEQAASHYLNRLDVQQAMHVVQGGQGQQPKPWALCNAALDYSREDLLTSMLPVYQWLLKHSSPSFRILVYSGDVDGIIPTLGTRIWVRKLGILQTDPWEPWTDSKGQVGGYTVGYGKLQFMTVRNAGHMVPYTQPVRGLDLLDMFLATTARAPKDDR